MIISRWHTSEQWTWIDCINNNNNNARNMWWWRDLVVVISWQEAACSSSDDNCLHGTSRQGSVVLTLLTERTRSHLLMKTTSDRDWSGVSWTLHHNSGHWHCPKSKVYPVTISRLGTTPGQGPRCRASGGRETSPVQLHTLTPPPSIHNILYNHQSRINNEQFKCNLDVMASILYLLNICFSS